MRKFSKSVKTKNFIMMGIAGLSIIVLGSILLIIPLHITAFSNTSKIARLQCHDAGEILSMKINSSADIIRNYSYLLANLVETDLMPPKNKREFILKEMETRHKNEKALNNLWGIFEPNAIDGMDADFVHRMGSDEKGIFNPWFEKYQNIEIIRSASVDYVSDYYAIPKKTKKEAITDPYWDNVNGEKILMISFSAPILLNDTFLGVIGTDFYINELDESIAHCKHVGISELVTDKGIIIIHENPEFIGTSVSYDIEDLKRKVSEESVLDEFRKTEHGDKYVVFVPIYFSEVSDPWFYIVEVPANQIYAEDRKIIGMLVVIFLLLVVSVYFYIKTVEKNRELNKLHTVKDKLFSVVAHDLRSPIGSLITMLELVKKKMLDPETQTKILIDISKRVEDVYRLLDNLLRWAKNQMQGIVIAPVYFDTQDAIHEVLDSLQNVADAKKISLMMNVGKQDVFADRDMFLVIIRNLVSNAIKFTRENGEITIVSEISNDKLHVSVTDTGTGMSPEVLDTLFTLTKTMSVLGTNNETGTGLGLLLCADFVKANGGKIWVSSKQDEGSKFSFSVPLEKSKG